MWEMQEIWVQSLAQEDPLEEEMQPTPVFLPGKSHGQRSLAGYTPWGLKQSNMTKRMKNNSSNTGGHPPSTRQVPTLSSPEGPAGTFEKVWRFHHLPSPPLTVTHIIELSVCVSLVPFFSIHLSHPQGPFQRKRMTCPSEARWAELWH